MDTGLPVPWCTPCGTWHGSDEDHWVPNLDDMIKMNRDKHPWRPAEFLVSLAVDMAALEIPWCNECADWHMPDEEHSAVEERS